MYDVRFGQARDTALHNPASFELLPCVNFPTTFACVSQLPQARLTSFASQSPHDCCFGVAPRLLTPAGQKLCFWPNWLTAVASFHPSGAKANAFGQTGLPPPDVFPRKARELPKLTHRRPIGGSPCGQRMRAVHTHLPPSCVLYIVHPTSYIGSRFAAAWGRRQFSPLRGKSCAFGQTGLQPPAVFREPEARQISKS